MVRPRCIESAREQPNRKKNQGEINPISKHKNPPNLRRDRCINKRKEGMGEKTRGTCCCLATCSRSQVACFLIASISGRRDRSVDATQEPGGLACGRSFGEKPNRGEGKEREKRDQEIRRVIYQRGEGSLCCLVGELENPPKVSPRRIIFGSFSGRSSTSYTSASGWF